MPAGVGASIDPRSRLQRSRAPPSLAPAHRSPLRRTPTRAMWPYVLAAAAGYWLWRRGGDANGDWRWSDEESTWVWEWGGRYWIWLDELPWVRYAEDPLDWPPQDRARAARLWWSFDVGPPRRRAGGRFLTHPLAAEPGCWRHWAGLDPWAEAARFRHQDAARASTRRLTVRKLAALQPGPAEELILGHLGAPVVGH